MKKIPLFCTLSSVFCIGVALASTSVDLENANYLADQGIISKQSVTSKYRLDDTITRAEVVGMALKIKGVELPNDYTCKNYFSDVRYNAANNWVCRAMEIGADEGIISKSNTRGRPGDTVTRAEALAMVMGAWGVEIGMGGDAGYKYYFESNLFEEGGVGYRNAYQFGASWQAETFYQYIRTILKDDTQLKFNPRANNSATRAEVIGFGRNIVNSDTVSHKIYKNDTYKYTIEYPNNYEIFESANQKTGKTIPVHSQSRTIYLTTNSDMFFCCEPTYLSISILDTVVSDFEKYASEKFINTENFYRVISKNASTFASKNSYQILSHPGIDSPKNIILFNHNNKTYLIRYDSEEILPGINSILESFQLTE